MLGLRFALPTNFEKSWETPKPIIPLRQPRSFSVYAINSTTPPASLILISAFRDTYRALTITGVLGRRPFPRTLVYPWAQLDCNK